MKKAALLIPMVAAAVYGVAIALSCLGTTLTTYDEPITLTSAWLMRHGYRAHVDFWSIYPALGYQAVAAAMGLLGESVLSLRALFLALWAAMAGAAGAVVMKRQGRERILTAWCLPVFLIMTGLAPTYQFWPAVALLVIFLLAYFGMPEERTRRRLYLLAGMGLLTGVTTIWRVNMGVYLAIPIFLDLTVLALFREAGPRASLRARAGDGLIYGMGIGAVLAGYLFVYRGHIGLVLDDVAFTSVRLVAQRFIPLPGDPSYPGRLAFPFLWIVWRGQTGDRFPTWVKWGAPLGIGMAFTGVLLACGAMPALVGKAWAVELLLIVGLHLAGWRLERRELMALICFVCFTHYALSRIDDYHMAPLGVMAGLLLLVAAPRSDELWRFGVTVAGTLAIFFSPVLMYPDSKDIHTAIEVSKQVIAGGGKSDIDRFEKLLAPATAPWWRLIPEPYAVQAAQFIRKNTKPEERVYVGPVFFEMADTNHILAMWLLGRPPAIRAYVYSPGLVDGLLEEEKVVEEMRENHVKWALLSPGGAPSLSAIDQYLRTDFTPVAVSGPFVVMKHK